MDDFVSEYAAIKDKKSFVNIKEEYVDDTELQFHCPFRQQVFNLKHKLTKHAQQLHIDKTGTKEETFVVDDFRGDMIDPLNLDDTNLENNDRCVKEEPELTCVRAGKINVYFDNCQIISETKRNNVYSSESDYSELQKSSTESRMLNSQTEQKLYSCNRCHKSVSGSNLSRHMKVHTGEKPYTCDICTKSFSRRECLKRHMKTHTGEKPYSCEICKNTFSLREHLKTHMVTHSGEKPYCCDVCAKSFPRRGDLKKHIRSHTGEKPYYCEICNKSFSATLKTHMICHTGEKPFSCEICKKSFRDAGKLKRHMVTHTGEKLYSCDICKQRFALNQNLKRHMRIHTGEN